MTDFAAYYRIPRVWPVDHGADEIANDPRWRLTHTLLVGLDLTDDARGVENGSISWVEGCAEAVTDGSGTQPNSYYRHELGMLDYCQSCQRPIQFACEYCDAQFEDDE